MIIFKQTTKDRYHNHEIIIRLSEESTVEQCVEAFKAFMLAMEHSPTLIEKIEYNND